MQKNANAVNGSDQKWDIDLHGVGGKRRRAPNYTDKEIRVLMSLVVDHMDVIESKQTDSTTWRMKDKAWNSITEDYNKASVTSKRTSEMIRQKYESMKKTARRKEARNREETDAVQMEEYEKELLQLLELHGGYVSQKSNIDVLMETKLNDSVNIKSESSSDSIHFEDDRDEEAFIITDDDRVWDLGNNLNNRSKLYFAKKQLEQLEREEQRQITEHQYRMKTQEIKTKVFLQREKRARLEHVKKMELLELEIEFKKKRLGLI
ncbi:hypothetical protein ABEB36_001172 [Hypothenemus hampei]|uniref:Regulatory protein zeste n=1 Tax=Hypothenemus hampei TaxID=57062 RepID=A0ABD1FDS8_HYPHA